jgi:hypothetical protein
MMRMMIAAVVVVEELCTLAIESNMLPISTQIPELGSNIG